MTFHTYTYRKRAKPPLSRCVSLAALTPLTITEYLFWAERRLCMACNTMIAYLFICM